jgi:hypothetical protein
MQEEQHVGRRRLRADVGLRAASARCGQQAHAGHGGRDGGRAIAAAAVDHDDLGHAMALQLGQPPADARLLVEYRNDDGDGRARHSLSAGGSKTRICSTRRHFSQGTSLMTGKDE